MKSIIVVYNIIVQTMTAPDIEEVVSDVSLRA